jgi:hypothetical protein
MAPDWKTSQLARQAAERIVAQEVERVDLNALDRGGCVPLHRCLKSGRLQPDPESHGKFGH